MLQYYLIVQNIIKWYYINS